LAYKGEEISKAAESTKIRIVNKLRQ
jgi:hypothetical protein